MHVLVSKADPEPWLPEIHRSRGEGEAVSLCPKCGNLMDGYEGKEFHGFPTRYKALWLCDICGHLVMVSRDGSNESKVGGKL